MVYRIYPPELQLNRANTSNTETLFLDIHLSISNGVVLAEIFYKREDFNFGIVNVRSFNYLRGLHYLLGLLECQVM